MDTLKAASLIINALVLVVVITLLVYTIFGKKQDIVRVSVLGIVLNLTGRLQEHFFSPLSDAWFRVYTFNQDNRLWKNSPKTLDVTRGVSLFWLGHDLMWTAIALISQREPKQIRRGLTLSGWQMEQSGLSFTNEYAQLRSAVTDFNDDPEFWTDKQRSELASRLITWAHVIGVNILNQRVHGKGIYFPLPPRPSDDENVAENGIFAVGGKVPN